VPGLEPASDGAIASAQQCIVPLLFGHQLVGKLLRRLVTRGFAQGFEALSAQQRPAPPIAAMRRRKRWGWGWGWGWPKIIHYFFRYDC